MPNNRIEQYLAKIKGDEVTIPDKPLNRIEKYLAIMAGQDYEVPSPLNRIEQYLSEIVQGGSGGGGDLQIAVTTAVGDQTTEIAFAVNAKPKFFGFEAWSGTSLLTSKRYITGGTVEEITADGRYKIHSPSAYMQSTTGKINYSERVYGTYENGTLALTAAEVGNDTVFARNVTYKLYYVY